MFLVQTKDGYLRRRSSQPNKLIGTNSVEFAQKWISLDEAIETANKYDGVVLEIVHTSR